MDVGIPKRADGGRSAVLLLEDGREFMRQYEWKLVKRARRALAIAGLTLIVERSFARLDRNRRLSKDYACRVQTSELMIDVAAAPPVPIGEFNETLQAPFNARQSDWTSSYTKGARLGRVNRG
jgi:hypothetical protein